VPDSTVPDPVGQIDPRPLAGSALASTNRTPPADGFFEPAPFKGAFNPGSNWSGGWSNLSRLGVVPMCDLAAAPGAVPDEVMGVQFATASRLTWSGLFFNNRAYDVVRSTDPRNLDAGTCLESGDGDTIAADLETPMPGQAFFYAVRGANSCGAGTLGFTSGGAERRGPTCP
jgi:hypothetical protein